MKSWCLRLTLQLLSQQQHPLIHGRSEERAYRLGKERLRLEYTVREGHKHRLKAATRGCSRYKYYEQLTRPKLKEVTVAGGTAWWRTITSS